MLRLYQAGTANIVATEGSITTPSPPAITVSAAAASKFVLAADSATPTAGVVDNLTTTAQDTYGNTATSYTGVHSLVFSGASASPGGTTPTVSDSTGADIAFGAATTVDFTAGVAKASEADGGGMKLYKSGSTAVKATEGTITTPTAVTVTVAAGTATKLVLTSSTATPVAATGFNLTTTAQDVYGNTATGYTGSKNITFAGATASPSGALPTVVNAAGTAVNFGTATALTFTNGVATPASSKNGFTKLNKVETANVTASDGTISTAAAARPHRLGRRRQPGRPARSQSQRRDDRLPLPLHLHDHHARQLRHRQSQGRDHRHRRQHRLQPRRQNGHRHRHRGQHRHRLAADDRGHRPGDLRHRIHLHRPGQRQLHPHDHRRLDRLHQRHRDRHQIGPTRPLSRAASRSWPEDAR